MKFLTVVLCVLLATPIPEVDDSKVEIERLRGLLVYTHGFVPEHSFSVQVTVTAYSARVEECDATPWLTADGSLSTVGQLAVSRDLLSEVGLHYGQLVTVGDLGMFRISDTMNKRWSRRVDILMANKDAADRFGVRKDITLRWFE